MKSDDLKIIAPEDQKKINVNQEWELEFWSKKLGISKILIKHAVGEVGPMVDDVKNFFK